MGRYYKIVLSFVLAIFMMTNTIFAYGEKSLNIINITHLFKQIQQIKFAQLESSTLQSQYKFDLSENTMDKKLVKILVNIYSFHSFSDFIRFKKLYAYKTND